MKFRVRYRFWNVFLIVLAVVICIACFAFLSYALFPNEQAMHELNKVPGRTYLLKYGMGFIYIVIFLYFTTNYFYWLIVDRKKFISYLKVVFIIILGSFVYHTILFYFLPEALRQPYPTLLFMFFAMVINLVFYFGISLLVAYITTLREGQKQRKILEAQKLQLEVEKSEANLNFLKAQINPHFLHNTLNFLYAKSIPYSPDLSEGILTLSDIMRYALSEGNARDGKAPLKDEIEHVRNVIKINQLRFSNTLNVRFNVEGVLNGATIIPFVLITLVENAFKHGDLKNSNDPIIINLKVTDNNGYSVSAERINVTVKKKENKKLYFYCRNRKKSGSKELSTGIGLENIKKRLDLAYGDKYKFIVKDESEFYTTELIIDQL